MVIELAVPYQPRQLPSLYTLGWHTHRWSGWPGAFCMLCGIVDPNDAALVDDLYDTWMIHPVSCPFCPCVPYGADPYKIDPPNDSVIFREDLVKGPSWGFFDKTWANFCGGFATEYEARIGLNTYCLYLNTGKMDPLPAGVYWEN